MREPLQGIQETCLWEVGASVAEQCLSLELTSQWKGSNGRESCAARSSMWPR